jgi:tight adherence protein C
VDHAVGTAGASLRLALGRAGIGLEETARRLAIVGRPDLGLFLGQKVAAGVIGFAFLPIVGRLGGPATTPLLLWLALGAGAFLLPDALLKVEASRCRDELEDGVAEFCVLVAVGVSGGLGVEQAVHEALEEGRGPFAEELRGAIKGRGAREALEGVASMTGLPDAAGLAAAVRASERGAPLARSLQAQAWGMLERRRHAWVARGQHALIWMALVTAALMVPGVLILLGYPGVAEILRSLAR